MDRKYYAFDLDGTLSDIHGLNDYLDFFKMHISNDAAYKIFISKIAEKVDKRECTLFNLKMIFLIIREKISDAVIYSNNSDPNVLAFAKDVIEALLKRPVFCYLMHWNHHLRNNEIVRGDRGNARKTWSVLKKAFAECGHDVKPEQVYYFDDQIHPDLKRSVNYTKVKEYRTNLDLNNELISKIFRESLEESGIIQPLVANNNFNVIENNNESGINPPLVPNINQKLVVNNIFNDLVPINKEGGKRTRSRYRRRKVNKKTNKKRRPK
jgi:hypothetical protein